MIARDKAWFEGIAHESGTQWFADERRRVRRLEA
jgi:hypothetical protein